MGFAIFGTIIASAIAQTTPVQTDQIELDTGTMPLTERPEAPIFSTPAGLEDGHYDSSALTEDPGFDAWFEGAIRVQRGEDIVFSIERGMDAGGKPLSQDSIFWVGSISKTFCSTAVLQLVDEGVLALDDPIGAHLPGWEPTDATVDGEVCTVARLLSHECGFPREAPSWSMSRLNDPIRNPDVRAAYLEEARNLSLEFAPGSDSTYSNIGYNLAGLLVMAKDTGTYDEIVQRRLFAPLGLTRTGTEPDRVPGFFDDVAGMNIIVANKALSSTTWLGLPADAPSRVGAAGHGFSTPAELTRFFEALTQGELLEPETFAEMIRPRETDDGYGLGIALRDRDGVAEYWHNGALEPHGLTAHTSVFPEWHTTVTVLSSRGVMAAPASGVAQRLIDALLQKEYRSPFPVGVGEQLMANLFGLAYIIFPIWVLLSMAWTTLRPLKKPRVAWAVGFTSLACSFVFLRGILGLFGDGIDVVVFPGMVCGVAAAILWFRLKNDHTQPMLLDHPSRLKRAFGWMNIFFNAVVVLFLGWWVGAYGPHFTALLGFAIWRATQPANALPRQQPATKVDP